MRISDWSSDVCSSDLARGGLVVGGLDLDARLRGVAHRIALLVGLDLDAEPVAFPADLDARDAEAVTRLRSEERRVGKECVRRVDLGGRRIIKKKKTK